MAVSMAEQIRPLRRVEYDKLIELGAFDSERIELLNGALVPMSPTGPSHSSSVQKLATLLLPALLGRAAVRVQSPFAALELSEPEPDIVVAPPGDYDTEHPSSAPPHEPRAGLEWSGSLTPLRTMKPVRRLRRFDSDAGHSLRRSDAFYWCPSWETISLYLMEYIAKFSSEILHIRLRPLRGACVAA
jgi:hypothetical protein